MSKKDFVSIGIIVCMVLSHLISGSISNAKLFLCPLAASRGFVFLIKESRKLLITN